MASKIQQLLKKTAHHDKDERFMATSDLTSELEKVEGHLDPSLQTPVRDAILKQLDDPSNDVQAIACRCLSAIVQKFNAEQVEEIVDKLGSLLIQGTMESRDIYTIALKTIVGAVPEDFGTSISKKLIKPVLQGLKMRKQQGDTAEETQEAERNFLNRQIACLDILKDLSTRFGYQMGDQHQEILNTLLPILNSERPEIRKKVATGLGAMVGVVNDEQFRSLMTSVTQSIKRVKQNDDKIFTYIQSISVFSRNAGKRISEYLKDIVPLLISFCSDDKAAEWAAETVIELRETCLQAFETLIVQCPKEVGQYTKALLDTALHLMKYDPNFSYDDGAAEPMDEDGAEEDDEWGDDDGGDWDDDTGGMADLDAQDDDTAWKVRRAAVKMITAFVQTHKAQVQEFQQQLCNDLLEQFVERDPNVKLEIFVAFRELLLASVVAEQGSGIRAEGTLNPFEMPPLVRQVSAFDLMSQKLPEIMQNVVKQLSATNSNAQVKSGLLGIVRDLVLVRQAERSTRVAQMSEDGLRPYFAGLIPELMKCIKDQDVQLRAKALYVLYLILKRHRTEDGLALLGDIQEVVLEAVADDYSRVKAQALLTISRMVECIRPMEGGAQDYDKQHDGIVKKLFAASLKQLSLKDIEQEVKKAALDAVAACLAYFGDLLADQLESTLAALIQRLNNEVTRQTALHAFTTIAESPLKVDLSGSMNKLIEDLSSFLKKNSSALKLDTATTLRALMKSAGAGADDKLLAGLIKQCAEFINDSDLHLCHLILDLLSEILRVKPSSSKVVASSILPCGYEFLQSPLLQGAALDSLKGLLVTFQETTGGKEVPFEVMKGELIKAAVPSLSRQSYAAISQCLSALILKVAADASAGAVKELIALVESKDENHAQVALLCIGEIGRAQDLSSHEGIETRIFQGFSRESEAVKWAASYSLGNVAVGNMSRYVPILLKLIEEHPDSQYLLLNSLKEIIGQSQEGMKPYVASVVPLLLNNASSKDEGVRAMVAECLGKFAVIEEQIFGDIEKLLGVDEGSTRATMAASLKFALSKEKKYELPTTTVQKFLSIMDDEDLAVKRQAFLTLNAMLHLNARLVKADLKNIMAIVYAATITNQDLIREVDLGPFKHKVDDGLPLRKAAFQCLDTVLASTPQHLQLLEFLKFLKNGITDDSDDIQMLTYQVLARLAQFHGSLILPALDDLPDPLMKGIKSKLSAAKGGKDAERAKDILRASCKALFTLKNIANADASARKFCTFYSRVQKTKLLIPMLAELQKEKEKRKF